MAPATGFRLADARPRRIAVVRALQLGDLLCAVPALRALRAAFPHAEITLVGLPWAKDFVERFDGYLDRFLELPGWPGLPEIPPRTEDVPAFLADAQRARFDVALQMHGSGGVTNPLTALLGAPVTAGFFRAGEYCPDRERFLPYPENVHESERLLRLLDFVGVPRRGEELEFPLRPVDFEELRSLGGADDLAPGAYACVHPGGRSPDARWPPERFAAVADELARRGVRVVLTGTAVDADAIDGVVSTMCSEPLVLAGGTSLGVLGALLSQARLLVSNDTGVAHLAVALAVPSVVVYREDQIARWGPRNRERHRVVLKDASTRHVVSEADDLLRTAAAAA